MKETPISFSFSFFLWITMVVVIINEFFTFSSALDLKMEMLHRHHPQFNPIPKSKPEYMNDLIMRDKIRHSQPRERRRLVTATASIEIPIRAGRDYGAGEYFVTFKIGTPPQEFLMIADTGSDLTWLNCIYRCPNLNRSSEDCNANGNGNGGGGGQGGGDGKGFFDADLSSSFTTIDCSSDMCKVDLSNLFSLTYCPTNSTPCNYDYRYIDGSSASGLFATETVTLDDTVGSGSIKINNVLVGCNKNFQGSFEGADGVLGLAYENQSFLAKAFDKFGTKFSYCLVDHLSHKNVSNYLTLGENNTHTSKRLADNIRVTQLDIGSISPFYALNVRGISIGGLMLDIPNATWDANLGGGTIIDSGTSLVYLSQPAYQPVIDELLKSLSKFDEVVVDGVALDHCFNSTGFQSTMVPRLTIHFVGGARFKPHVKSYVIDVADGVKCLGFIATKWPSYSVIGNILQQNYLWEFDLAAGTLGFAPSTCRL